MLCGPQVLGHSRTGKQDIGAGARDRHLWGIDAALGRQEPRYRAQKRGLAGAIGPDQSVHAGVENEVRHVQAALAGNVLQLKVRHDGLLRLR